MEARACIFCSLQLSGNRAKEHVIPEWLLAHLAIRGEVLNLQKENRDLRKEFDDLKKKFEAIAKAPETKDDKPSKKPAKK